MAKQREKALMEEGEKKVMLVNIKTKGKKGGVHARDRSEESISIHSINTERLYRRSQKNYLTKKESILYARRKDTTRETLEKKRKGPPRNGLKKGRGKGEGTAS